MHPGSRSFAVFSRFFRRRCWRSVHSRSTQIPKRSSAGARVLAIPGHPPIPRPYSSYPPRLFDVNFRRCRWAYNFRRPCLGFYGFEGSTTVQGPPGRRVRWTAPRAARTRPPARTTASPPPRHGHPRSGTGAEEPARPTGEAPYGPGPRSGSHGRRSASSRRRRMTGPRRAASRAVNESASSSFARPPIYPIYPSLDQTGLGEAGRPVFRYVVTCVSTLEKALRARRVVDCSPDFGAGQIQHTQFSARLRN